MPAHKRITGDMVAGMLKLAGSGKSAAEIAAWILAEHKVKVSDRAVRQHLAKVAKDREPLAKAVVQEQLSKTLTADITALDRLLGRAHQVELDAGNPEKLEELDKELARLALSDIEEAVDATGAVKPLAEMPLDVRKAIASVEVEEVRLMDEIMRVTNHAVMPNDFIRVQSQPWVPPAGKLVPPDAERGLSADDELDAVVVNQVIA
jgi:hypothetical protein